LTEQRVPTGKERASAVKIAQMLEKAKYRERSITDVRSVLPQGRLKTRIAIQNLAMKSKGVIAEVPAWERTLRKHTDDPTLSIGVMVDISGSMGSAMDAMATTAWVLSESGRRVQARTAMVYYGSGVFPTLKVGQKLEKVSVYTAPDGTEKFGDAWDALDGHLGLTFSSGVKLLVIVSDGHYTNGEYANAQKTMELCKRNGVAVVWVVPKGCGNNASRIVGNNGVVLDQMETDKIAMAIGKSATDALSKIAIGG
jgi:Mg-chelatase subunit ChlD